jgi:hypothetical protein
MRDHVRILAYLHIVLGSLGLVAALLCLLIFGGLAGIVGATNPTDTDAWRVAMPVIGVIGIAVCGLMLLLSIPGIILGLGLLKLRPWARVLGIVMSALDLLHIPIGTALGIYGLWVLLQPETERLLSPAGIARP